MNPILVNVWRGNAIESSHRGSLAVVRSDGHSVCGLGDVQHPVFPRSSIKFLQAIPFVESGAVERYELNDKHIALSCASHNGESVHVEMVDNWLKTIGYNDNDLECGATLPMYSEAQFELMGSGAKPRRAHNNCSGKHAGLLSTCAQLGESSHDYRLYSHRAQQRWFDVIESMSNVSIQQLPWGYDGCGIPCIAMPLSRVALAMARFADANGQSAERRDAIMKIQKAVSAHPYMVAGKERLCTDLMEKLSPDVLVKVGAEGCYAACVPAQGLGIALKMDDGNMRGANVALGAVLEALGLLNKDVIEALQEHIKPELTNTRGDVIGRLEASSEWKNLNPNRI